ncbi:MAG: DUF4388 domain-containing protein [Deltaproteobacteria bacterium]|nr:DUF4388 domain-containing protein [Deltaproteobacteria bacterium]
MALYGSLKTMSLPDLFQWLKQSKKSGALTLTMNSDDRSLYFTDGRIEAFSSRELRENLGQMLVGFALVKEADINKAFREQRQNRRPLSVLLVERGYVNQDDVRRVLSDASRDIVLDLFLEEEGSFVFSNKEDVLELDEAPFERVPLELDMEEAILEGIRRLDEWSLVRAKLPRDTMRLEIVDRGWFEGLKKSSRESMVFQCIDRRLSLGEICLELRASRYSLYRLIDKALASERVRVVDQGLPSSDAKAEPAESNDRVSKLVVQADAMLEAKQWDEAGALLELICRINPDDSKARASLRRAKEEQAAELFQTFGPIAVPKLAVAREQIRDFRLSSEEQFIASRVNGEADVGALVMMSPIGELQTLKILNKLQHIGVIVV